MICQNWIYYLEHWKQNYHFFCLKQHLTEEGYLVVSFYLDLVKASLRLKMIQMYLDPVVGILAYFH